MGLYGKCTRCFKSHDLPLEYQQGPAQVNDAPVDSDSSNESSQDQTQMTQWTQSRTRNTLSSLYPGSPDGLERGRWPC
jgi:hypothetical protein